jgi:hypothetical protein
MHRKVGNGATVLGEGSVILISGACGSEWDDGDNDRAVQRRKLDIMNGSVKGLKREGDQLERRQSREAEERVACYIGCVEFGIERTLREASTGALCGGRRRDELVMSVFFSSSWMRHEHGY